MTTLLWLKAFHVIFMVAWFAGIFYLPRLFVNHAETTNQDIAEHLKGMEKRLLYFVTPFGVLTIALGIALIYHYGMAWFAASHWLHAKLTLVVLLVAYHLYCFKLVRIFREDKNTRSGRFYRIFNEVPVLALFAIVILVYVKPF
ncbi:protoporphyrinogen oxidase HemJ [Thalassotalea atypica]|uniref:protoporphyrinogen oxidase HemJ n=1 Tax=Thalassotalea atypica TaxID=2054316 RepID=UPI002572468B|nr:protoporphyrinogen oxidase HemJ [Thalassotalea atypica]